MLDVNPDLNCQLFVACWAVGCLCPRNLEDWCGYRPQIMYAFAKMVVAITKPCLTNKHGLEPKLVWCQYPNKPSDGGYFPFSFWPWVRRNTGGGNLITSLRLIVTFSYYFHKAQIIWITSMSWVYPHWLLDCWVYRHWFLVLNPWKPPLK